MGKGEERAVAQGATPGTARFQIRGNLSSCQKDSPLSLLLLPSCEAQNGEQVLRLLHVALVLANSRSCCCCLPVLHGDRVTKSYVLLPLAPLGNFLPLSGTCLP